MHRPEAKQVQQVTEPEHSVYRGVARAARDEVSQHGGKLHCAKGRGSHRSP